MRQHPVCGGYGLCPLEMCVCRHQHIFERRRLIQHYLLERSGGGIQLRTCVDGPQTGSGRNLIVATAPGVELGGDVPHFFVEHAVDECVDVLIRREWLCTGRQFLSHHP